jgi:cytochrome c
MSLRGLKASAAVLALLLAAGHTPAIAADAARGEQLYSSRCGACHSLTDNGAGPRHRGLLGRKAGTQPGFDYSAALAHSGIVWNAALLDRWIANPSALVPGNKMVVQLASDPKDRADIIAFLEKATARTPATARTTARTNR